MTVFHIRCDVDSDATGWDEILFKDGFEEWLNRVDSDDWTPPPCRVSNVRITKLDSEEASQRDAAALSREAQRTIWNAP